VNAAALITQATATQSIWETFTGQSVTELISSLNVTANAEYKGVVFSGKVESEFSLSSESKQTSYFAKARGVHQTRDERLNNTAPAALKNVLHADFLAAIASESAASLLNAYGTHLLAQCYWGGEAEFNYSYWGSDLKSATDIRVALNASYGKFSADASVTNKEKATQLAGGSDFTSSSRGGANTTFTSAEAFNDGYEAWVTSIETKPDICAVPDCSKSTLIPLWTVIAPVDAAKAAAVKAEFDARVSVRGTALDGYVYVPPVEYPMYVTDLDVYLNPTSYAPAGFPHWVRNNMYYADQGDVLNTNSVAAPVSIAYKTEAKAGNHDAIAAIAVYENVPGTGWVSLGVPVFEGLKIGSSYIYRPKYLWYRKVTAEDTEAIDFIGGYSSENNFSGTISPGYFWVIVAPRATI